MSLHNCIAYVKGILGQKGKVSKTDCNEMQKKKNACFHDFVHHKFEIMGAT